MTRRQRSRAVAARADLILADEPSARAYTAWFETQTVSYTHLTLPTILLV